MLTTLQGQCVQGANLLQIFARKGKAAHIAFLVEQKEDKCKQKEVEEEVSENTF